MTETTSVLNYNWNVTQIGTMSNCGFNSNFHGDTDDCKRDDAAIAQRNVQGSAFKGRHGDLVENRFTRQRTHLRNQMEPRRVPQEPRLDLVNRFHSLPGHSHPQLR